jgi:hypothetical protein
MNDQSTTGTNKSGRKTKAAAIARLLSREKGATIEEIIKATEWQAHSCRAFLTGLRKKGSNIIREERGGGKTAYRMVAPVAPGEAESIPEASA